MAEPAQKPRFSGRLLLLPILALGALLAMEYFAPAKKTPAEKDSTESTPLTPIAPPLASSAQRDAHAQSQAVGTLETSHFIARFSDLNGALLEYKVKDRRYHDHKGQASELVTTDKDDYLPLVFDLQGISLTSDARWTLETQNAEQLVYVLATDQVKLRRTWQTESESFGLHTVLSIENISSEPLQITPILSTSHYVHHADEKAGFLGSPSPLRSEALCRDSNGLVRALSSDLVEQSERRNTSVRYLGTANVYFATLIVPEGETRGCLLSASERGGTVEEPDGILFESAVEYKAITIAPAQQATLGARAYLGPKKPDLLAAFDPDTRDAVDLGWFAWIAEALVFLLAKIHGIFGNWGFAIIGLTFLVKLVLYPLTERSFRSMARMRVLKPEMDRINELYGSDREKKGAAIMELYRTNKINPLGGCLPTLFQMPIWFALYQSLSTNIELYRAPFVFWWSDLSAPDPYFALPLLVGALMFVQQKLTPSTMDPVQTKMMLYIMPIMFTSFMLFLPSGLCLYIATNSILGIAQQKFVNYRLDRETRGSDGTGNSSPPVASAIPATSSKG